METPIMISVILLERSLENHTLTIGSIWASNPSRSLMFIADTGKELPPVTVELAEAVFAVLSVWASCMPTVDE